MLVRGSAGHGEGRSIRTVIAALLVALTLVGTLALRVSAQDAASALRVDDTGGAGVAAGSVSAPGERSAIVTVENLRPFWVGVDLEQQHGTLTLTKADPADDLDAAWAEVMIVPPHGRIAFRADWDPALGGSEVVTLRYGPETTSSQLAVTANVLQLVALGLSQGRLPLAARAMRAVLDPIMQLPDWQEVLRSQQGAPDLSDLPAYGRVLLGSGVGRAAVADALGQLGVSVTTGALETLDLLRSGIDAARLVFDIGRAVVENRTSGSVVFSVLGAGGDQPGDGGVAWTEAADAPFRFGTPLFELPDGRIVAERRDGQAGVWCADDSGSSPPERPGGLTLAIYDPATDTWSETGPTERLNRGRFAALPDGRVLGVGIAVWGSRDEEAQREAATEILDVDEGAWRPIEAPPLGHPRGPLVTLRDGRVLVLGGERLTDYAPLRGVWAFDAGSGTWSRLGRLTSGPVLGPTTVLHDGTVLVRNDDTGRLEAFDPADGSSRTVSETPFDWVTDAWDLGDGTAIVDTGRGYVRLDLTDGAVLARVDGPGMPILSPQASLAEPFLAVQGAVVKDCVARPSRKAFWFDPISGSMSPAPRLPYPIHEGALLPLRDGRMFLLVAGGRDYPDGMTAGTLILGPGG